MKCNYKMPNGACSLQSIYSETHNLIAGDGFCKLVCGPDDSHKINMINKMYEVTDFVLLKPEIAISLAEEKRENYLIQLKQSQQMPSIVEEAKELGKTILAVGKQIIDGKSPLVSEEEQQRRLKICESCERYNHEKKRCAACGCYMNIKAWLEKGKCKLEKWNV